MKTYELSSDIKAMLPKKSIHWIATVSIPDSIKKHLAKLKSNRLEPLIWAKSDNLYVFFCIEYMKKKNRLVQIEFKGISNKYKFNKLSNMTELNSNYINFNNLDFESSRIFQSTQKYIYGIKYDPIVVTKIKNELIYLVISTLANNANQILLLHVSLNSNGYYQIDHIEDCLKDMI